MNTSTKQNKLRVIASILFFLLIAVSCQENKDASSKESEQSPSVEAPTIDMHAAVIANDMAAVKQHIAAKSDINVLDPFGGSSPLISAAIFGKTEIAKVLIDAGAKLDIKNNDGSTALISAAFFCRPDIVKLLLKAGADKTITNNFGSNAFQSVNGSFDQVKPSYDMIGKMLKPMGLNLDYDYMKKTRPEIATLLQD